MYWAADTQDKIFNGVSEEDLEDLYGNYLDNSEGENPLSFEEFKVNYGSSLDRILLDLEKQILLHPRNAHQLLMPLTDEIFVKDIYDDLKQEGLIKEPSKSFTGAILPSTNVNNTTIFVKGKYGVGPVALGITNSSTNQADELSINDTFINNDGVRVPTKLLFKYMGDVYALDNYTDNKGTVISEILSQLLTTQVDNVKNPTAVLMNINMQTLGVMLYLIRRKINPKSIVLFLQQPIIAKYLQYQRQNESLFNKQADTELSKKELLIKLKSDLGYKNPKEDLPDVYEVKEGQSQFEISDREMLAKAKSGKFDENQLNYLAYFIQLQSQARSFSDFQQTQNSDTKGLKDKQMLDEANVVSARAEFSEIIKPIDFDRLNTNGVIAPFYNFGRRRYSIYNRFFALAQSRFGNALFEFKNKAAAIASSANKDRVRQTIENDFMLFLVHKYVLNKSEFDRLTKGDSVAKRVRELKIKLPSNLVLKAFFPMLANTVDRIDDRKIDNLRLFEKELNSLDSNDLRLSLEEIADTDIDLYNDIVKLLMFQSGLNISPFNYRSVIPVGLNSVRNEFNDYEYLYQDILKEAITKMNADRSLDHEKEFKTFVTLFSANNPQFLKKHSQYLFTDKYPYPLAKVYDRGSKSTILRPAKGNESQPQLGDAYYKQYFEELINSNLFNTKVKQSEQKEILNVVFDDDIPFTEYEDVTNPKVLALGEGEKSTKLKIISGGQFGGDLGGLLAAKELGLETGGTAPKGFKVDYSDKRSIKGSNPDLVSFGLVEDDSADYPSRTMKNVDDSDGTIAFMWGSSVGTSKTIGYAQTGKWVNQIQNFKGNPVKPILVITTKDEFEASVQIKNFVQKYNINTLNIAGHRETSQPGIEEFVKNSLVQGLKDISVGNNVKGVQGSLFEPDQSQSNYSPSLKMYENFVQTNQLYVGDEILPLIGESEYYRYLVPMLLKMNPDVITEFTNDMGGSLRQYLPPDVYDYFGETWTNWPAGMSIRSSNFNIINAGDSRVKLTTIVHELVHRTLQNEYEKGGDFQKEINKLYDYAVANSYNHGLYGYSRVEEFLAEALANPDFMEELNNISYGKETVWTYLMILISDFINNLLSVELKSDSVLAEVVRASEQVLNKNLSEVSKEKKVSLSEFQKEIVENWDSYFPDYSWMNSAQREMTAKLAEEGKIQLNCSI